MKILTDVHTHTNCSNHVFSTVLENINVAKERGLELICMTDHAPAIPDGAHIWHFETMFELPEYINGVRLLKGVEANILDTQGHIDIPLEIQKKMEVMIASIHRPVFPPKTKEAHTETWLNVIKNPYVTILGHTGNTLYPYDYESVIEAAYKANKCIEINNHSPAVRAGCYENCRDIAMTCKKLGANIVVNSDAHTCFQVGEFGFAMKILAEVDFPEDKIMNLNAERFLNYLKEFRGKA